MHAPAYWVIIDSDKGLFPVTWTNSELLQLDPSKDTSLIFQPNRNIVIQGNAFEYVCKYRPFCSRFVGVNAYFHTGHNKTLVPAQRLLPMFVLLICLKISSARCQPFCSDLNGVFFFYQACKHNGQFLPHQYDQCSYYRCDYGKEPWFDEYGNIKFVAVPMKCAHGTSTNRYEFEPHNPCGETSYDCGHKGNDIMTWWRHDMDPLTDPWRGNPIVNGGFSS